MATPSIDLSTLDRRIADKLIRSGQITQEQWDAYLGSLPDLAEKAEKVETEFETGIIENE